MNDSQTLSPEEHLTILNTEKEDVETKLSAALETNQHYEERINFFENRIQEVSQKAKPALVMLNETNNELLQTSIILQAELDELPEIDVLKNQYEILSNFCENDPRIKARNLDISFFYDNHLLDEGQKREDLIPIIENLTHIYFSKYGGVFNFRVETDYITDDCNKLMNLIKMLEGTMRKSARNYLKQTKVLKDEIQELKDMINKYKAKKH